jgi:hypothetical protein
MTIVALLGFCSYNTRTKQLATSLNFANVLKMKRDKKSLGLEAIMGGNLKMQNLINFALKGDTNMSIRLLAHLNKMG